MYTNWMDPVSSSSLVTSLDRMVGDYQFTCPVVDFAQYLSQSDKQENIFMYQFNHRTENSPWPAWSGVMHGDEIAYVFGDPLRLHPAVIYTEQERSLAKDVMTYWANFAKSG